MRLYLPLCFLNRHWPDRPRVRWDGNHWVGTCRICRHRIRRCDHGRWERDWLDQPAG